MTRPSSPSLSEKKAHILKAAATLFAEHGYAAVSMRDLAREVQITPAALYHHFHDKAAIHAAALRYSFADKVTEVSDLVNGHDAPEVKLERLIGWVTLLFLENPVLMRLLQRELLDGDAQRIRNLTEGVITTPLLETQKLMQQLAPERDSRMSSVLVMSVIMGFVELSPVLEHLSGQIGDRKNLLNFADHATQMVLSGLATQPPTQDTY